MTAPRPISAPHQREVWGLLERRVISLTEAGLLLVLLSFAKRGRIFPSVASIARRAGCSERLVQKLLKRLVGRGILTLVERAMQHRPNEYAFAPLAIIARGAHRAPLDPVPGGTSATPLRGAQCAPLAEKQGFSGHHPEPPTLTSSRDTQLAESLVVVPTS